MVLHHHDNDVVDLAEPLGRGRHYPIRTGARCEGRESRAEEAVGPVVPIDVHGRFQSTSYALAAATEMRRPIGTHTVLVVFGNWMDAMQGAWQDSAQQRR
jgi:hypothetical protein